MAEKTVILRPVSSDWMATASGTGQVPSDTAEENAYLLVNEVEADDDATYIHFTSSMALIYFGIDTCAKGNIKGVKTHVRAKGTGSANVFSCQFRFRGTNVDDAFSTKYEAQSASDGWYDYILDWSNSTDDIALFNNTIYDGECLFGIYGGSATAGKSAGESITDVTQVYVELTYEEAGSGEALYVRENGTWKAVEGTVYRKENGAWVQSGTDVFTEGDKFALVTV